NRRAHQHHQRAPMIVVFCLPMCLLCPSSPPSLTPISANDLPPAHVRSLCFHRQVSGVDEAIGIVNARPKLLVVMVFTSREDVRQRFLKESSSGAVVANELILQRFLKESSSGAVVGNELILQVRQGGEGSGGREERSGRESDNHAVSLQHGVPFGGVRDSGTGQ
ncbi:unnamed protein product, partial [Closterium sp. NIES-64]